MKVKLKIEKEYDVATLHVRAKVRYWEDATVNETEDATGSLIPCRNGENWTPVIDVNTGKIIHWTLGVTAEIHYKVCDAGSYELRDSEDKTIITIDGYVPKTMCPGDNGYGDYIIMTVDENGVIENWNFRPEDFVTEE